MIPIHEYIKDNLVIMDGAFGTYFVQKYGAGEKVCEWANIEAPQKVAAIHYEYLSAGAKLICSNTFLANAYCPGMDRVSSEKLLRQGYAIARRCADERGAYAAADIGPVTKEGRDAQELSLDEVLIEYKRIIDIFLDVGADIFVFETMADVEPLDQAVAYLKGKSPEAFVLCQFAVRPDGYTRTGIGLRRLMEGIKAIPSDAYGLNCASGPAHMERHVKECLSLADRPMSALPNSGFPMLMEGREIYQANEKYYAELMLEMVHLGIKFPGGCCGTTPGHIAALAEAIAYKSGSAESIDAESLPGAVPDSRMPDIDIFVELTPPHTGSAEGLKKRAGVLKNMGVNKVTLPDSPLGRSRMNPLMLSCILREQSQVDTLAHLCCRDRNITAVQSDVMAAWAMGLRKLLCITGDPVAAGSRDDIKSVFNLTAIPLIELIRHMNEELFEKDPIEIYGAVNLSARNFDSEMRRAKRKADAGAIGLLSQAVYTMEAVEKIRRLKDELNIKVYAGILPPVSYRNALFLKHEVPGIDVPDDIIQALAPTKSREEAENVGVEIIANIAKAALEYADGLYLMLPFGRVSVAAKLFNQLRGESNDTQ